MTAALAAVIAPVLVLGPPPSSAADAGARARDVDRRVLAGTSYDLGVRQFAQPLDGRFAQMPIRLWGALAVPEGEGPFPVVVVAHGAHGDGCPDAEDVSTWPCWSREQRNDLGFAGLAEHLAEQGMIAVVPDLNAAYTGGWGEFTSQENLRFRQVLDATLDAVRRAGAGEPVFAGIDLDGRVEADRVGVLGHSRGGYNAIRWSRRHDEVRSLFLLAPYFGPRPLPPIAVTVAVGTCDGDTGNDGLRYVARARRASDRPSPLVQLTVSGANHDYYNTTLVAAGDDDTPPRTPGCQPARRATPAQQQAWLARVATAHFRASLTRPSRTAAFLSRTGPERVRISGVRTDVRRFYARP